MYSKFPMNEDIFNKIKSQPIYPVHHIKDDLAIKLSCIFSIQGLKEEQIASAISKIAHVKPSKYDLETWLIILSKNRFIQFRKLLKIFGVRHFVHIGYLLNWINYNNFKLEVKNEQTNNANCN